MTQWTRRAVLRSGILASAAASIGKAANAASTPEREAVTSAAAGNPGHNPAQNPTRSRTRLDQGWRFSLGNAADPSKDFGYGAMSRNRPFAKQGEYSWVSSNKFDDKGWRIVDLPHDWAVELPFNSTKPLPEQGGRPIGREFPDTSIGWYRKSFTLAAEDAQKRIWLEFDGVLSVADIFINGHFLARHMGGYVPLRVDVTDWMNFPGKATSTDPEHDKEDKKEKVIPGSNLIVVRCDVTMGAGWFYEGAGIYRHVWLTKLLPLHLTGDGSFASSRQVGNATELKLIGEATNDSDTARTAHLLWELVDAQGKVAARQTSTPVTVPAWSTTEVKAQTRMTGARLWSCEDPYCYTLRTTLVEGAKLVDTSSSTFGIRTILFHADKGFLLNGKSVKIKGTCNHHDHAGVGAALPDALHAWRLARLQDMGSNALRTSHNCPAPELVEAASRMGVMIMCETRLMDSSEEALSQLSAMIRRYRNHPSIIIWSLGNEEPEQWTPRGVRIVSTMKRTAKRLDPSRPVTVAQNDNQEGGFTKVVDVLGFNYNEYKIDKTHKEFPALPIIGTETASTLTTRGIYKKDETAGYVTAYDTNVPDWGKTAEAWWKFYAERPFLAGGFAWTGFDYRGEPTPYSWPCVSSHFGIMDVCGYPKDTFFYYKAWWGTEPVLHLFPHWNWQPGAKVDVWVHSNLDRVELFLNGRSLGIKKVEPDTHLSWGEIAFEPGTLEARAYKGDTVALTTKRETTGAPASIVLVCDRQNLTADNMDTAVVKVSIVDAQGRIVPIAGNKLDYEITGPGKLLGLANGDPSSHEPDKATSRSVFNGLGVAIVQSSQQPGEIVIEASSPNLKPARFVLPITTSS